MNHEIFNKLFQIIVKQKVILSICAIFLTTIIVVGEDDQFKDDEYIKFRIHYGFVNAGYATLNVNEINYEGKPHFHAVGKGWTVGAVKLFFKVDDNYETYIDKTTQKPSRFIRKINEGGFKKNLDLTFDHESKKVIQIDKENGNKKTIHTVTNDIQDMLSAFYYLRNYNTDNLKTNDFINLNVFMDKDVYPFKLKILGREKMKTKFGKISCLKIRPYVQSGRVFKANESVTMWVTDDKNKVPVQIKAELAVGSLKADLEDYKNISTPLNFTK